MSTHLGRTTPKARKPHRCWLCGLTIPIGEVHCKDACIIDGDFNSARAHLTCDGLIRGWKEEDYECHDEWEFREHYKIPHPIKGLTIRKGML
jgi:hypothetical protein